MDDPGPGALVLGVGCRTGAPPDELLALATSTLTEANLSWSRVKIVATVRHRLGEPAVQALAQHAGARLIGYTVAQLAALRGVPSPSARVASLAGTPGVAEPAALLASNGGTLIVTKRRSANATLAVARRGQGGPRDDRPTMP